MEKEYLGEVKSWEEIEKKAKELLEEGKIDTLFFSLEKYMDNLESKYLFTVLKNETDLKKGFNNYIKYFFNSSIKQYNLLILKIDQRKILIIIEVCYE